MNYKTSQAIKIAWKLIILLEVKWHEQEAFWWTFRNCCGTVLHVPTQKEVYCVQWALSQKNTYRIAAMLYIYTWMCSPLNINKKLKTEYKSLKPTGNKGHSQFRLA